MGDNGFKIDENGKLIFPDDWQRSFFLVPHPDILAVVNGNEIFDTVEVKKEHPVTLKPVVENEQGQVRVEISKDRLFGYVQLKPTKIVYPGIDVEIKTQGVFVYILPLTKKVFMFEEKQIHQALQSGGVFHGINNSAIRELLDNPSEMLTIVARGEAGKPGVDESINVLFDLKGDDGPEILPDGRVGFKQKRRASVELGQVLAVKIPGQLGEPGKGVDGQPIDPPNYKRIVLRTGPGANLQPDGISVVASERGLPSVRVSGNTWIFYVESAIQVEEVNLRSGNLKFVGDIRIDQDVAEGMSVFGSGDVFVGGSVHGGNIVALKSLSVGKNLVGASVKAGGAIDYLESYRDKLKYIYNSMKKMHPILIALKSRCEELNKPCNIGQMVMGLVNKNHQDILKPVDELNLMLTKREFTVSKDIENLVNDLVINFKKMGWLKIQDLEAVEERQQRLFIVMQDLETLISQTKGDIILSYAINSRIEVAGDVRVCGRGCLNTIINAGGDVTIDAVFRGGEINCNGIIKIQEAGSELGIKTSIKTKGYIKIAKVHPGVFLMAGQNSRLVNSTEYNVLMQPLNPQSD